MEHSRCHVVAALLSACALLAGCGKTDLNELVDQAKKKAAEGSEMVKQSVVETVDTTVDRAAERLGQGKEVLNLAGDMQLTAGDPVTTQACYLRLIDIGDGRPHVLQLASYRQPGQETFPSVFAQAPVAVNSLEGLAGQTIAAKWFLQRESSGPVLFTEGAPIELRVRDVSGQTATIEIIGGQLHNSQTGEAVPLSGMLHAVMP
jgi:hypothetical protein